MTDLLNDIKNLENENGVYQLKINSGEDQRKLDMVVISNPKTYWNLAKDDSTYYLFGIQKYRDDINYFKSEKFDKNKDYKIGNIVHEIFGNFKLYFECIEEDPNGKQNKKLVEKYWKPIPQFFVPCLVLNAEKNQKKIEIEILYLDYGILNFFQ